MKNKIQKNGGLPGRQAGEMSFGIMIILFLIALFFIWYFTGGPNSENAEDPFLKVETPKV